MASKPHLILQLVATTGIAAMLSAVAPAVAAEIKIPASQTAAPEAPDHIRQHVSRRVRIAASHHDPHHHHDLRVSQIPGNLGCSGNWCGRQFVLMIGVGY
jgi:hypothetical protein